ncbi:LexA family protein [Streptomyces lydicamycinicus]|uniref:LexA family protein n=1 Tax=Streptomyces lydicamycinicus TaxID=1546107 RepID=UPI003C30739B
MPAWRSSSGPGHRIPKKPGDDRPLTDSQRRIARALRQLTEQADYPPSIREIADAAALSASTVAYHLPPACPGTPRDRHPRPAPKPPVAGAVSGQEPQRRLASPVVSGDLSAMRPAAWPVGLRPWRGSSCAGDSPGLRERSVGVHTAQRWWRRRHPAQHLS